MIRSDVTISGRYAYTPLPVALELGAIRLEFITQNLLGASAAQSFVGRKLGRMAFFIGAMGGAVPDFDTFLRPLSHPALPFGLHRHFTHALTFIPVGAALAALPFILLSFLPFKPLRELRSKWGLVYLAAFLGCATHGVLDLCTSFGTYILWPFSHERYAWDNVAFIDPVFSVPLLLGVLVAFAWNKPRAARVALIYCVLYLTLGFVQHERAVSAMRIVAQSRGHEPVEFRVHPTLGNQILWRSVYIANGRVYADAIRVPYFGESAVQLGTSLEQFTIEDLPANIREPGMLKPHEQEARDVFIDFHTFSDGYTVAVRDDNAAGIIVADMRYSRTPAGFAPLWGIVIRADDPDRPVDRASLQAPGRPGGLFAFLYETADELINPANDYVPISQLRP